MEHKMTGEIVEYDYILHEYTTRKPINPKGLEGYPYDQAAFDRTEIGRRRRELDALYQIYRDDPMNGNLLHYWGERGLRKELFDNGGSYGFDAAYQYSVFTPLGIQPGRKYAAIYFCHGGGQPIEWAEHYGFNTLAATEKYIVIYAQNGGRSNNEVDTEFPRIIRALLDKGYPIDEERIYVAGFSSGSEAAAAAACTCPEYAAAIAVLPGGQPFKDLDFYKGPEHYASTRGWRIPGIFIGGTEDASCFPSRWMLDYYGSELGAGTVENAVENLNRWMRDIAQLRQPPTLTRAGISTLLRQAEDPVEREFGLVFDRSARFHVNGTDWLGGDYFGRDGAPVMRFVRAVGVPHVVWESQANLVWDYLKHFRRDPRTGESSYDPVVCWGER